MLVGRALIRRVKYGLLARKTSMG